MDALHFKRIDSGVDSRLLRWTSCMSRELDSGVLLYKSYKIYGLI